jgi:hypothetical protein
MSEIEDSRPVQQGKLQDAVSKLIVRLFAEYMGRGPTHADAHPRPVARGPRVRRGSVASQRLSRPVPAGQVAGGCAAAP